MQKISSICEAVLIQYRRVTDGQTDDNNCGIRASTASRG